MILATQQGKCAICERLPSSTRSFDVDHCHRTGRIRGLLCFLCNKGLGYFRESEHLYRAGRYFSAGHTGFYMPKKKRKKGAA